MLVLVHCIEIKESVLIRTVSLKSVQSEMKEPVNDIAFVSEEAARKEGLCLSVHGRWKN